MTTRISGIHHVTAIAADGQKNIDFYCGVLGLRLIKVTVNFDDPQSDHLVMSWAKRPLFHSLFRWVPRLLE